MSDETRREPNWRDQRREAFEAHAAALARRKEAETARARAIVGDFVARMMAQSVPPHPLRARVADGRRSYRTKLTGWYVRRNRALAVGVDGEFYILDTPPSLRKWLLGADVMPSDPPLVVGEGARDGESIPLDELLEQRLAAGSDFG